MNKIKVLFICLFLSISLSFATVTFGGFYFDGVQPQAGETISYSPIVTINVTGTNVSYNAFELYVDSQNVLTYSPSNYSYDMVNSIFRFAYSGHLSTGYHTFQLYATDQNGLSISPLRTVFVASSEFTAVENPIIYPSPATSNVKITYELTASEEVKLYIYDLNGQIVFQDDISAGDEGAHAGFNAYPFDLKSSYGNKLPNGVYVVILIKKEDGKSKIMGKKKFIILKNDE